MTCIITYVRVYDIYIYVYMTMTCIYIYTCHDDIYESPAR